MFEEDNGTSVMDRDEIDLQPPKDYVILGLNDNYTTVELVMKLLVEICHKTPQEAAAITDEIHKNGKGPMFVGAEDICYTKQLQMDNVARKNGAPFRTVLEVA
jgi:ATP-dependent Clp protease adaptor protein ClpS